MNSGSLGKARRGAVRKVVFMLVLMLVTLAYAATPLTAFACDGANGAANNQKPAKPKPAGGAAANKPKPAGGAAANKPKPASGAAADKKAIADLNGASKIASLTINKKVVQLADIKPPQKFLITFADGVKLNAQCIAAGNDPQADVTLPSGAQVQFRPKAPAGQIVTAIANPKSIANASKRETFSLFLGSSSSDWQLFKLDGSPLDRSAITTAGQKFQISKIGSSTVMLAFYKGNNSVLVTVPPSKQLMTIPLSDL